MLSPIARQRYEKFKKNRRSWYSLWIFTVLLITTLFSEFIANDKPLLVQYKNSYYFPVFKSYPETTFDGDFETETNYKDQYIADIINKNGWMIWPLIPYSYDTINFKLDRPAPAPPSWENWLGTDDQGRDLLARLLYSIRFALLFGLLLTGISLVVGVTAGAVQGYFGGKVDLLFQRFMEIWSGIPIIFLMIILSSFVTPNFWWLLLMFSFFKWMMIVPVVRAEFLRAKNYDYVRAAKAMGVNNFSIIWRHILPNVIAMPLTVIPFVLTTSISLLATLDFLGFGLPPGSPSLGEILNQGKNNLYAPWIGISGFLTISILLSILVFIGEGVRDALNPKKGGIDLI